MLKKEPCDKYHIFTVFLQYNSYMKSSKFEYILKYLKALSNESTNPSKSSPHCNAPDVVLLFPIVADNRRTGSNTG
jgi:hypothetical protein